MDNLVGVFVKVPEPGRVKTRLGRDVGMTSAASFYAGCVAWLLKRLLASSFRPVVFYTPSSGEEKLRNCYGDLPEMKFIPQRGENLGEKMFHALSDLREDHPEPPLLIGSDTPLLPVKYLRDATESLENNDVVLGPSEDGGYYLVGMTRPRRELFFDMAWSHSGVFEETLDRIKEQSLSVEILPEHNDIDTVEDLMVFLHEEEPTNFE